MITVICGPQGSGKTRLAESIAKNLNCAMILHTDFVRAFEHRHDTQPFYTLCEIAIVEECADRDLLNLMLGLMYGAFESKKVGGLRHIIFTTQLRADDIATHATELGVGIFQLNPRTNATD